MKREVFFVAIIIILGKLQLSIQCNTDFETDCFESSNCDQSSNYQNCQTTNCCQSKNCCQTNCQSFQSCRRICNNACRSQNCAVSCQQRCCNPTPPDTATSKPTTHFTQSTSFTFRPTPTPGYPPVMLANSTNVINNVNNSTFENALNINNTIFFRNNITVPISVNNQNQVDVKIVVTSNTYDANDTLIITPTSTPHPIDENNSNEVVTTKPPEPIPIPIPVPTNPIIQRIPVMIPVPSRPVYIPVPYPIVAPQVRQQGCCFAVNPCLYGGNCQPYTSMCGSMCTSNYIYAPSNPCSNGCQRREFAPAYSCQNRGYCQQSMTDCSKCGNNFYQTFQNYRQCALCFYR